MREIEIAEVEQALEADAVVIDVLSRDSYEKMHIPGSISVPSEEPDFVARVAEKVPDKSTPIVTYCAGPTCQTSPEAARRLDAAGFEDVREFRGGLEGWANAGHRLEGNEAAE